MAYSDYMATQDYLSKQSGSAIEVVIINADDPADIIIGATTGINSNDDFEAIPVEEAGEDGTDEIVQGRHSCSISVPAFWTPEWNDNLPTRQDFIGRTYTILERIGEDRPGAGTVVNAFTGCVMSREGFQMGARGAKTVDMAFLCERRYNGKEWSELAGSA